ncbi:PDZ domain-containing protein [bacterium]|nr:MAG: PDZ domain-containing protein [bacterium]
MRKFTIHPLVFISTIIVSLGGGLYLGDNLSGQLSLPGLKRTSQLDFSSLNDVYGLLQRNFDGSTDDTKALEGAKAGLVASVGDPYTTYLTATEADKITNDLAGKLSGIGAEIGLKNNTITVIAPIADAPAEKAGLKAGDYILKVNDEDTTGMTVDSAVSKIRGAKGTTVKLNLARSGTDTFDVTITRDDITVPSVKSELKNGNVAYIRLTQFGPDSATQVRTAATNLKSQGATKIILDLRNNPEVI